MTQPNNPADEVRRWLRRETHIQEQIHAILSEENPTDGARSRIGSLANQGRTALKRAEVHALANIGLQLQRIADDLTAIPPALTHVRLVGQAVDVPGLPADTDATPAIPFRRPGADL